MSVNILGLLSFSIIGGLYCIFSVQERLKQISILEQKSIKFYLDRKLMVRIIDRLIHKDAIEAIIYDVIEYFVLDDIIIYNLNGKNKGDEIAHYIENHRSSIIEHLSNNNLLKVHVDRTPKQVQEIIIQYINPQTKKLIIYLAKPHNKLSRNDIEMLTEAVTPILQLA